MKILPAGMQAHLDSGVTTLCNCWRLTLRGGETLGFTDHDVDVVFDRTTFEASAGFTASELESSLGLSVDNLEAAGALQSGQLDETRLKAGDFDHAEVELWRVNWQDVSQRLLMRKGHLGEVTTGAGGFTAEVRGLSHQLNAQKGRLFQYGCDALLGDARCGVNALSPLFAQVGVVSAVAGTSLTLTGITHVDDWHSRGTVTFLSGAGTGRVLTIKRHRKEGDLARVELWQKPPFEVAVSNSVRLTAGCDKSFATCKTKFSNVANFRGFPHMPGTDYVTIFPKPGDPVNDGGRRG